MLNFARADVAPLGVRLARPAARRQRDRLPQVGHEPGVHRGRLAGRRRPAAAVRPSTPRPSTTSSTGCAPPTRGVRIETCTGGGGRVDLGILARTDQAWTSDNTDPVDRIAIQHGFSQVYPARDDGRLGQRRTPTRSPAGRTPLRFRFHVAMAGALGIGGNLREWSRGRAAGGGDAGGRVQADPARRAGAAGCTG